MVSDGFVKSYLDSFTNSLRDTKKILEQIQTHL